MKTSLINRTQCPIDSPKIKSVVVFQSVEAPQIEPMDQQDYFPYDNYDLVMGKPAGVLVELEKARMDRRKDFAVDLYLGGENYFYCFHSPLKGKAMVEGRESSCEFTRSSFTNHKFFPLQMDRNIFKTNYSTHSVQVNLYPRGYKKDKRCRQQKTFNIRIIKTFNLNLGFTRIKGGQNCYASQDINTGYDSVSYETVEGFAGSDEVLFYIPSMFPVEGIFSNALKYTWGERSYDYISGACHRVPDEKRPKVTMGLLKDIKSLEYIRASLQYHKLIAIVPESYFVFHRGLDHDSSGFIVSPKWEWRWIWLFGKRRFRWNFLGGSWNIAFIHEKEKDKGTIAHELAHTVGQDREFYKTSEQCQQFRGESFEPCKYYQILLSLDTWIQDKKQHWEFVENKYSIMNNEGEKIDDLWSDRDTFQKIFRVLSQKAVIRSDEDPKDLSYYRKAKTSSLKAVISGFYHEKESAFIVPSVQLNQTKLLTPSFSPETENIKWPVVTFQLKEENTVLQKIQRPVFKMQIKTLYKNKSPETKPFEFSPLMAAFKLPENHKAGKLKIIVLNPKGKKIYSAPVPKKPKPTEKNVNVTARNKKG